MMILLKIMKLNIKRKVSYDAALDEIVTLYPTSELFFVTNPSFLTSYSASISTISE